MITLKQAKQSFFTARPVRDALDRASRKILSRFGAFVRQRAKTSMRKATSRRRVSAPGQPPLAHTGLLRQHIYFGYDPVARSVIIGPVRLGNLPGTAPKALEFGGVSLTADNRRVYIRPRPYMAPALRQELDKLPPMWKNALHSA